jgi:hypothetical protein
MLDKEETPGFIGFVKDERPYERILDKEEIPGSVRTEDNP